MDYQRSNFEFVDVLAGKLSKDDLDYVRRIFSEIFRIQSIIQSYENILNTNHKTIEFFVREKYKIEAETYRINLENGALYINVYQKAEPE